MSGVLQVSTPSLLVCVSKRQGKTEKPSSRRLILVPKKSRAGKRTQSMVVKEMDIEMRRVSSKRRALCFVIFFVGRRGLSEKAVSPWSAASPFPLCVVTFCASFNQRRCQPVERHPRKQKRQGSVRVPKTSPSIPKDITNRESRKRTETAEGAASCACLLSAHTRIMVSALSPLSLRKSQTPKLVGQPREK